MSSEAIYLPDTGSNNAVAVIEILVKVGDTIAANQALCTLESDKATMDVPAPKAGVIKSLAIRVGDKIKTGDLVAELELEAGAAPAQTSKSPKTPEPAVIASPAPQAPASSSEPIVFKLPDTGSSSAVSVIEIAVKEGDTLSAGQTLCVLESDKATMDVPAPAAGQLQRLLIKVGDKIHSGADIAHIVPTDGTQAKPTPAPSSAPAASTPTAAAPTATPVAQATPAQASASPTADVYAGPSVRRMARLLGVDLARIQGTGEKGRISKDDVRLYVKTLLNQAQQAPAASSSQGFGLPSMPNIDFSQYGPIETKPLSRIKKLTAQNLSRNWLLAPHVTQFEQADISELEAFRKAHSASYDKQGIKLTPLVFIMKAVVGALKAFPAFNASLDASGEQLILKRYFHIGIAVDTPEGLVVPVIRDVDQKSIGELAKELAEVSVKARNQKLTAQDMQGSCFTISSLGGIGGTAFTPIINLPNVAILGVSKASTQPVWDGQQFLPKLMLPLSLSYDHRVIDGAEAARFTVTIGKYLQDIRLLLL